MARGVVEWERGCGKCCCSFKRITYVVCCVNLVAVLLLLRSLYTSFIVSSSRFNIDGFSVDQLKKIEESIVVRREAEPAELVIGVRGLRKGVSRDEKRKLKLPQPMKQKLAIEILQRLQGVKNNTNMTKLRGTVDLWRLERLEEVKTVISSKSNLNSSLSYREARMLKKALETNLHALLEGISLWMPEEIIHTEHKDKPENEPNFASNLSPRNIPSAEEIIPGRSMPPECHAELHTDYDGAAVRWGLTHHKESAADCCLACLDQAKRAKPGEMKCNIWVYCPSEFGCYSPDIYEHKHQECWLKQADKPRLNFKDRYSESYKNNHPNAPIFVPWMSGVVSA